MADDFRWTVTGRTAWSKTYEGKQAVTGHLLQPLYAQFADRYRNTAQRFIAEDEWVVVQCRGDVRTKRGQRYDNEYCYVCRFSGEKLRELKARSRAAMTSSRSSPGLTAVLVAMTCGAGICGVLLVQADAHEGHA